MPSQEQTSNDMQIVALDPSRAYQLLENGMPCMVHLVPEFQKDAASYYVSHHKDLDVDLHLVGAFHSSSEHWSGMLLFKLVNGRRNIKTMEVNLLCVEDESTGTSSHLLQYSAQQCGAKSIQASVHGAAMEAWWQQRHGFTACIASGLAMLAVQASPPMPLVPAVAAASSSSHAQAGPSTSEEPQGSPEERLERISEAIGMTAGRRLDTTHLD